MFSQRSFVTGAVQYTGLRHCITDRPGNQRLVERFGPACPCCIGPVGAGWLDPPLHLRLKILRHDRELVPLQVSDNAKSKQQQ